MHFSLTCWNQFLTESLQLLFTYFVSFITNASSPRVLLKPLYLVNILCIHTERVQYVWVCAFSHSFFVFERKAQVSLEMALVFMLCCSKAHTQCQIIASVCSSKTLWHKGSSLPALSGTQQQRALSKVISLWKQFSYVCSEEHLIW